MCLGQAKFPRQARVLNRRERRRAGAAIVARNNKVICFRFGHARGNSANADFCNQLNANARGAVCIFQIVN